MEAFNETQPAVKPQERGILGVSSNFLVIYACIIFMYLYFFPYFDKLNSSSENVRLYMVKAIVEHGTFSVSDVLNDDYAPVADLSLYKGNFYSCKAPGTSYLAVPFYGIINVFTDISKMGGIYIMRLFTTILPSLIFLFFFYRFLSHFLKDEYLKNIVIIGMALGTMFLTYGILVFGHQQAAIGLCGGFMLFYENKLRQQDSPRFILLGGFLLAFAVSCEYQAAVSALFITVYALLILKKKMNILWLLLGAVPPVALTLVYHYFAFDSIFKTGMDYLWMPAFSEYHQHGLYGFFHYTRKGFWGTFLSPNNGLFFYCPWLLFAFNGLYDAFKKKDFRYEAICISLVILAYFIIVSGMYAWKGGWTVGPRYLAPIVPFLVMAAAIFIRKSSSDFTVIYYILIPFMIVSMIFYSVSTAIFPHFPPETFNPFFEFILGLVSESYYPRNAGRLIGLGDLASALPYFLVLAVLSGYMIMGYVGRPVTYPGIKNPLYNVLITGLVVFFLMFALSRFKTDDPNIPSEDLSFAKSIWEPPR